MCGNASGAISQQLATFCLDATTCPDTLRMAFPLCLPQSSTLDTPRAELPVSLPHFRTCPTLANVCGRLISYPHAVELRIGGTQRFYLTRRFMATCKTKINYSDVVRRPQPECPKPSILNSKPKTLNPEPSYTTMMTGEGVVARQVPVSPANPDAGPSHLPAGDLGLLLAGSSDLLVVSRVRVRVRVATLGIFRTLGYLILGSLYWGSYYLGYYITVPYFRNPPT